MFVFMSKFHLEDNYSDDFDASDKPKQPIRRRSSSDSTVTQSQTKSRQSSPKVRSRTTNREHRALYQVSKSVHVLTTHPGLVLIISIFVLHDVTLSFINTNLLRVNYSLINFKESDKFLFVTYAVNG
jgi:hypothetical protein